MTRAIHQFVAGYSNGDAISNDARMWRSTFRSWGYASEIYCEARRILPELRKETRDLATATATIRPDDIVVLHLSIGSDANRVFQSLRARKVIIYHNITPPEFFRGYNEEIVRHLVRGREELAALKDTAEVNLAVSRFNAGEMTALGYPHVSVLPLLLDRTNWNGPAAPSQYGDGQLNILFVGRCAPNKRIEDLLFTLYFCQQYVRKDVRLIHVGSAAGLERYQALLRTKARELKVEQFIMAGSVRADELRAHYKSADVFLCQSEHEGFCIPLLEAMGHDVPVIAYDAGAIAETLDNAGILLHTKDFATTAELIRRVTSDRHLRQAVVEGQRTRLQRYVQIDIPAEMKKALAPLL